MDLTALLAHPLVRRARAQLAAQAAETFAEQLRIVAIPAPPLQEQKRAEYVHGRLQEVGVRDVRGDAVGNVIAGLGGSDQRRAVVCSAHLDTVFPADTDVTPRRVGRRTFAPGIADNARGLAALITLARVLTGSGIRTVRPVRLVATVGEEGIGDLRGVKHLFREGASGAGISAFVALDGSGLHRVVHRAIGARRLRVTVRGPGGHSWADWGVANPANAVGALIATVRRLGAPPPSGTTLTVARMGGGTSINAIPSDAWAELDLRGEDPNALRRLEGAVRRAARLAVAEESQGRLAGTAALALEIETIGDRPAGGVEASSPLVRAAVAATRAVGGRPELAASSTDANIPLSLGVPAVTMGAGGESGGIHTVQEWYADRGGARGLERALLTILGAAGVEGTST